MNFNREEYYRSVFKNQLSSCIKNMRTSAMQLAEAREENGVTRALEAQEKELQMRRERLREREEKVKKEEEKLRQYKLETAKQLQENEARRLHAIEKTKEEEAKIKEKEDNIKKLKAQHEALLTRKELLAKHHQESTAKMPRKNTGRGCGGTQSIRKEILERQADVEKEAERKKLELMKDIKEQRTLLLHYTNQLQQQQRELDNIRSETRKWEMKREDLRSTAKREELQYAQIKIRKHLQLVRAIVDERKFNVMTTASQTKEDEK